MNKDVHFLKMNFILQVTMSETGSSDADPLSDITSPPDHPPHTDPASCQDVPAVSAPPSAPLQPPLIPESLVSPQPTQEMTIEDPTTEETSQGPSDQLEPPAEPQVVECDQPVSLEPEATEDNVEVCSSSLSCY